MPPQRSESYDLLDHGPSDSSERSNPWPTPSTELRTSYRNLTRGGSSCSVILTWQTGSNCSTWLKAGLGENSTATFAPGTAVPQMEQRGRRQRILNPAGSAILRTMRDQGSLAPLFLPHSVLWLCTDGRAHNFGFFPSRRVALNACPNCRSIFSSRATAIHHLIRTSRTRPLSQTTQPTRTHHPHRGEGS